MDSAPIATNVKSDRAAQAKGRIFSPESSLCRAYCCRTFFSIQPVSKHRLFVWLDASVLPDNQLIAIAREDDYTFGVLHSRVRELWAWRMGTQLETRPRYTPSTCFETFPFPRPTDEQRTEIAAAANRLNEIREGWLNPPGLEGEELKSRTLTNLYNERPTWLCDAHDRLDRAVRAAYGWPADITNEELLANLLALNLERAASATDRKA
jgi:type II restriction/modification system DNA methylase subunit YeeA